MGYRVYCQIHPFVKGVLLKPAIVVRLHTDFCCVGVYTLKYWQIWTFHHRFSLLSPLYPQLPADHSGCSVRSLLPPVPEGHSEGPGRDVSRCPAPTQGTLPQKLPVAVHPQHTARWWRAARVSWALFVFVFLIRCTFPKHALLRYDYQNSLWSYCPSGQTWVWKGSEVTATCG